MTEKEFLYTLSILADMVILSGAIAGLSYGIMAFIDCLLKKKKK